MTPHQLPRILVVDDEVRLATAIQQTLGEHHYEVVVAHSTAEAIARLKEARFEILLTDLHMPEMDGLSLLQSAQALDPDMIGIMMTGHGSIDSAIAAMKAGAHDYILKPFKLSAALAVFARALATRRLRLENAALHERLVARTEELEAANRELETFSYSVSHDLRAPLRSIEGFSDILREELGPERPPAVEDALRRIRRATGRMAGLIDVLLQLARVSRAPHREEGVDLSALAREIAAKLQAEAPERKVEWDIQETPPAFCDAALLRVALENLLANAWKFSRGVAPARITVAAQTDAEGRVVYRVSDNGAGFDMKGAAKLFVPFQRLHTEQQFEGTGVGLATVQRIIHRHAGKIWADSTPGAGATFSFTIGPESSE